MMQCPTRQIKIIVVGDSRAGKTRLIHRMATKKWSNNFMHGIAMDQKRVNNYKINDEEITLQIFNYSALDERISRALIRDADAIIIAVDLAEKEEEINLNINNWMDKLEENLQSDVVVSVVGTKADLLEDKNVTINFECHKSHHGILINNKQIFITSAKDGTGIDKMTYQLVKESLKYKTPQSIRLINPSYLKDKSSCII